MKNSFVVIETETKKKNKGAIVAGALLVIGMVVLILITQFKIKEIKISGLEHYTQEEMETILKKKGYVDNSFLYFLKCKVSPPKGIPFVESMDVDYISPHKVSVTIYEKTMAGCIENMGEYMYFDKDGIVLESSSQKFDDVPLIKGLEFNSVVLNEKLPFKDKDMVNEILNITQLIRKYKLTVDTVKFEKKEVYLYCKDITVALGNQKDIDEKMAELPNMLKKAKGLKGVLHMENFTVSSGIATFDPR